MLNLTRLVDLQLSNNQISDISPLLNLTRLVDLQLSNNQITSIGELAGLLELHRIFLENNLIGDLLPLVNNSGIMANDIVYVTGNPLDSISLQIYIPTLLDRGVYIYY